MTDTIRISSDGGVRTIAIDRPAVRNALDVATLAALLDAVGEACSEETVRVIVLRGEGGAFCSGDDLGEAARMSAADFRRHIENFQRLTTLLRGAPQPVIASIDGAAYGGGLEVAVSCDARIASESARFGCPEPAWGLTLSNASSVLLRRLIGDGWARELFLFGRTLDASEALSLGLVTRVVPSASLDEATRELADGVLRAVPTAIALTKRLLNAEDLQAELDRETAAVVAGFATEEAQARLRAFAERKRRS